MSVGFNQVELLGHLGSDPELKHTAGGQAHAALRVATTRSRKVENNWTDVTDWHRVMVWGSLAEVVAKHIGKGSQVFVVGRLQTREFKDGNGQKQWITEVVANQVSFLGKKQDGRQPL